MYSAGQKIFLKDENKWLEFPKVVARAPEAHQADGFSMDTVLKDRSNKVGNFIDTLSPKKDTSILTNYLKTGKLHLDTELENCGVSEEVVSKS